MKFNSSRAVALALAVLMVGAVAGPAAADYGTSPVIDTSGTDDTTSVSEVQAGDTLGANNSFAANSSKNKTIQWLSNSNNTKVEVYRNGSGHIAYANSAPTTVVWNSTDADGHFNATMSHAALADVEHGINSNTTMVVKRYNNTSAASPATANDTIYVEWDNSTTVETVTSSDVGTDVASVTDDAFSVAGFNITAGPLGTTKADIQTSQRNISGNGTDVVVVLADQNTSDMFAEAAEGSSAGDKLSGLSRTRNIALVEDQDGNTQAIPVYYNSAPDSVASSDTYAVYEQGAVGGEDAVTVNLGDDYSDDTSVSVNAVGSAGLTDMINAYASASLNGLMG